MQFVFDTLSSVPFDVIMIVAQASNIIAAHQEATHLLANIKIFKFNLLLTYMRNGADVSS